MSGELKDPAVDLLYDNIGHLRCPDLGTISLMPFAQASDAVDALKRKVAAAIVNLFRQAGYPMEKDIAPVLSRDVTLRCRSCSTVLLTAHVDDEGAASVPAETLLQHFTQLDPNCPHELITADSHRRRIEEGLLAAREEAQ